MAKRRSEQEKSFFLPGNQSARRNLGLKFKTPEEEFLGQKATPKFDLPEFDPKSVSRDTPLLEPKGARLIGDAPEVVLLVGIQGSGKSHFAEKHFESAGYVVASNDRWA